MYDQYKYLRNNISLTNWMFVYAICLLVSDRQMIQSILKVGHCVCAFIVFFYSARYTDSILTRIAISPGTVQWTGTDITEYNWPLATHWMTFRIAYHLVSQSFYMTCSIDKHLTGFQFCNFTAFIHITTEIFGSHIWFKRFSFDLFDCHYPNKTGSYGGTSSPR